MHDARIQKIIEKLDEQQIDALLVTSLPNIYYLSAFTGSTAMLLITPKNRFFLTDFRYHLQVDQQVKGGFELVDNTGKKLVEELLPELPGSDMLKRIGFESEHVTHSAYSKLANDKWEFAPTTTLIEDLRMVKDAAELELIRESVLMNERIFTEILALIGPDVTEADLAAEIEYRCRKHGCSGTSFDSIIASGENSAKPHAGYTSEKLVPGTPLTFDMGVKLNGYCSDMTRTVFYKDCPAEWEKIYGIVKEAKDRAFAAVKPGIKGKEVDAVARNHIAEAGYAEHFGHGLGHGVGIEVHESPRLAKVEERELAVNHVVTNEPGIYLPGEGGVRIEDILAVTAAGAKNINTLPTEIMVVG